MNFEYGDKIIEVIKKNTSDITKKQTKTKKENKNKKANKEERNLEYENMYKQNS